VSKGDGEERGGVSLTHLDQPLFEEAVATKRDLVDYLDAVADLIVPELRDRPLSVMRVRPGQEPFMQKNVPKYTPPWVQTVSLWAESSRRQISYALCNDRRTLLSTGSKASGQRYASLGPPAHSPLKHPAVHLEPLPYGIAAQVTRRWPVTGRHSAERGSSHRGGCV
jgi:bifunctional non-homologous end joining protein LigD